jgi:hypothetical protein
MIAADAAIIDLKLCFRRTAANTARSNIFVTAYERDN